MSPDARGWTSVEREVKGEIMKTDVFVKLVGRVGSEAALATDLESVFQQFRSFEERFSRFRDESELTRFNRGTGGPISPDLFELLTTTVRFYRETGGVFDPSVLPILDAIGYRGAAIGSPPPREQAPFASLCLDEATQSATKPLGLAIDLGGIGKGFIVDRVSRWLREQGHVHFVVDAGGDIYAAGTNREENYPYWAFDIEHPLRPAEALATVLLTDEAVATSGRNRRVWKQGEQERHHLIDPKTGESVETQLMTVSVIAPSAAQADVWAKTLFILGETAGMARASDLKLPVLFVSEDGRLGTTPAWQEKTWNEDRYHAIMESLCTNFSSGSS